MWMCLLCFFFQAEDGIRDLVRSRGLGDVYKRQEFNRLLPNSELFWVDKCGHAPMMEQAGEFNNILDTWLTKLLAKEKV